MGFQPGQHPFQPSVLNLYQPLQGSLHLFKPAPRGEGAEVEPQPCPSQRLGYQPSCYFSGVRVDFRGPRIWVGGASAGMQAHLSGGMWGAWMVGTPATLSSGASHVTGSSCLELPARNPRSKGNPRGQRSVYSLSRQPGNKNDTRECFPRKACPGLRNPRTTSALSGTPRSCRREGEQGTSTPRRLPGGGLSPGW